MSQHTPTSSLPRIEDFRIAIAVAEWNGHITGALRDGALKTLRDYGMPDKDVTVVTVPGAVELTFAASKLIETGSFDAIIIIGSVIQSERLRHMLQKARGCRARTSIHLLPLRLQLD